MGIFYFPSDFVYWRKIPDHHIFKEKILKYITNHSDARHENIIIGNGLTSHGDEKTEKWLTKYTEFIKSVVWDSIDKVIENINSRENTPKAHIRDSRLQQCWYTVYDENSSISFHNHEVEGRWVQIIDDKKYFQSFTILYIIKDENEKNGTVFTTPTCHGVNSHDYKQTSFKTCEIEDCGEGTVFVFPSNLNHYVMNIPKKGRVIFSCDILSSYYD